MSAAEAAAVSTGRRGRMGKPIYVAARREPFFPAGFPSMGTNAFPVINQGIGS
jgi:hypothetical protein